MFLASVKITILTALDGEYKLLATHYPILSGPSTNIRKAYSSFGQRTMSKNQQLFSTEAGNE
jgi:hypothetical protein